MAIYTKRFNLFSEEGVDDGVITGADGIDLPSIEDHIDGNSANAEEIEDALTGVVGDPVEEAAQIIYENEYNYNQIMQAILVNEASCMARGYEYVYTEADIKGIFIRIKQAIVSFLEKIREIVEKFIMKVRQLTPINKRLLKSHGKYLNDTNLTAVITAANKNKLYFNFVDVSSLYKEKVLTAPSAQEIKALFTYDSPTGDPSTNYRLQLIGKAGGNANMDAKDYSKALRSGFYGTSDGERADNCRMTTADIRYALENLPAEGARKAYNKLKSSCKEFLKGAYDSKKAEGAAEAYKHYKNMLNYAATYNSQWMKACSMAASQSRSMLRACASASKKADKKEKKDKKKGGESQNASAIDYTGIGFLKNLEII